MWIKLIFYSRLGLELVRAGLFFFSSEVIDRYLEMILFLYL